MSTGELVPRKRQTISYTLERHALAARRFFGAPTAAHRRELDRERRQVREAQSRGEAATREDLALAHEAAARERRRDRMYSLCHCGRCTTRRAALRMYTLGFRDGVLGRLGKRRLPEELRPHRKHFKLALADGRRAIESALREYNELLDKKA